MTLAQTAIEKISLLSEPNIRIVLAIVNEMLRQNSETDKQCNSSEEVNPKLAAFQSIMDKREKSPFPANFDYEKAREEALSAKYGRFI